MLGSIEKHSHLWSVVRIPSSLRGSVDFFVASGRYSHMTLGVGHVGIVVGTISHLRFGENPLGFEWGLHGFGDELCGLMLGLQTHKESLI
jgi:hypothetical protein